MVGGGSKAELIVRLCREGVPAREIARRLGVYPQYVYNTLTRHGLSARRDCPSLDSCLTRAREYARVYGWLPRAEARDRIGCVPPVRLVPGYTWVRLYRARRTRPRILYWLVRGDMLRLWAQAHLHLVEAELGEKYGGVPSTRNLVGAVGTFLSPREAALEAARLLREPGPSLVLGPDVLREVL